MLPPPAAQVPGAHSRLRVQGAGLGLRRDLLPEILPRLESGVGLGAVQFLELAPENWSQLGGRFAQALDTVAAHYPLVCHGLSLNLGGTDALDTTLLQHTKAFMQRYGITLFTEHLSWCAHGGQLYDLLPLPCTHAAVRHVAARIAQVQDLLGQRIALENASYYQLPPGAEMEEADFIAAVIAQADCLLHLDVNNIYVNSVNHGFDAQAYLHKLPLARTAYIHVAGHTARGPGLLVDTHGAPVIDPVWQLLQAAYQALAQHGLAAPSLPTCLERDNDFPSLDELLAEVATIAQLQGAASPVRAALAA